MQLKFKFSVALRLECSSSSSLLLHYVQNAVQVQVQCCFTSRMQFKFSVALRPECSSSSSSLLLYFPAKCNSSSRSIISVAALRPECSSSSVLLYFQNAIQVQVQWCFTSTETVRTIRDGEPRTAATSIFTQFLSFEYAINGNLAFIPSVIARQSL